MNSEEGLRALESLHARLCVLERAHANRLGVQYPNNLEAESGIYAMAVLPIYQADGNLPPQNIQGLIRQITDELRDNRRVIDQNQFKENIFRRIRLASYSLHESYQVHQARTRQLKEVFEAAFKRAFVTPGG